MSANTEIDFLRDIKQAWVQILIAVLHSQTFCAFIVVSSISATSKLESLALFLRLKFQWANAFWLTSQTHHIALLTSLGSALGSWGFTSLEETVLHLIHSSQTIFVQEHCLILLLFPSVHGSPCDTYLLLPGLFTSNTNFLMYFPYPYTPKAPGWGEATLLWH